MTIKDAATTLNINYSTAKHIVKTFNKTIKEEIEQIGNTKIRESHKPRE
jgi:molybdenum-dependent DNA-binding transcriptional regulator ModE